MAVNKVNVNGYIDFRKTLKSWEKEKKIINILFTGTKDEKKISWCPDCNVAQPHIDNALEKFAPKDSVFLTVEVGDRTYWKDLKNPFREEADLKLMVIPTLVRWGTVLKLEGDHCAKPELLEMFFTEEEE